MKQRYKKSAFKNLKKNVKCKNKRAKQLMNQASFKIYQELNKTFQ